MHKNLESARGYDIHKDCEFCRILKKCEEDPDSSVVIYRDSNFFAFHDIEKASAKEHVLVCTRAHIQTATDISDPAVLAAMKQIGVRVLDQLTGRKGDMEAYRFGFHLRPYNSVDHVHMHCFVLPFSSVLKEKIVYGKMLASVQQVMEQIKQKSPKL